MRWPTACVRACEPLARHTSFRIGGPAEWFAEPSTLDELTAVLRAATAAGLPVCIVGGGTNTLAADRGARGVVIHLGREFRAIKETGEADNPTAHVACGAATLTQRLVYLATVRGWGGLALLAGLPGQLGGAVAMNAQGIGAFVRSVRLVRFDGGIIDLTREQLQFHYRDAALEPGIVTSVALEFPKTTPEEARERIRAALAYRNDTQEIAHPSAGCAFKNPSGASAGRLIDQAGLKGARIGDAQVSLRHANFIVNVGRATCDDVLSLMEYVQRRVDRAFGMVLEPEVRMIGERLY